MGKRAIYGWLVQSPADILKISKSVYVDWQQRVMDYGEKNNLPVICHLNLRHHFEFAKEFLSCFPRLRMNFPHFGFSRKKMHLLLDGFSNCYTDISGLYDYMAKDPAGYGDFIEHYSDRIMYGSDCAWNEAEKNETYLKGVEEMPLQNVSRRKLLYGVAREFLSGEPAGEDV